MWVVKCCVGCEVLCAWWCGVCMVMCCVGGGVVCGW